MKRRSGPPNKYKPGECVRFSVEVESLGRLVDPATVMLTIHPTQGDDIVVTTISRDSVGRYYVDYVLDIAAPSGIWPYRFQTIGTPPAHNGLGEDEIEVLELSF